MRSLRAPIGMRVACSDRKRRAAFVGGRHLAFVLKGAGGLLNLDGLCALVGARRQLLGLANWLAVSVTSKGADLA